MELSFANAIAWMEQVFVIASLAWLLPILFRIRHPRTQLLYCHMVLALCLVLPLVEPWQHPVIHRAAASAALTHPRPWTPIVRWILAAGFMARLAWLLVGLWRIRRYRIGAMPLYPIPESVRAASSVTQADALFCISPHVTGPVMLGWLAPVVLLPESFLSLDDEAQCGVVCHELLHVRRHDWLVTLLEELLAALFWFHPAIWPLLAQTRLSREELVDSEVVHMTGSRDSYIDALLTIARGQSVSDLAPEPAPLFLRRRNLTRRMDSLLRDVVVSRFRLLSTYGSIATMLVLAAWFVIGSLPLIGQAEVITDAVPIATSVPAASRPAPPPQLLAEASQPVGSTPELPRIPSSVREVRGPSVPVPPDVQELAVGSIQPAVSPADRAAAFGLLERAAQNSKMHIQTMFPYELRVSFTAGGDVQYTGAGELTESWQSGQSWRWTANLGGYSIVRIGAQGQTADAQPVSMIPMRIQMMRDAIFWAARTPGANFMVRTALAQLNGRPVTCLLTSNMRPTVGSARLWEEEEHCIDNASGLLRIYSVAPGTYAIYGYDGNQQFHGRAVPDRITTYIDGTIALDAQISLVDLGAVDADLFTITPEMRAAGPAIGLITAQRFPLDVGDVSATARPVIVHATIDPGGNVIEEELSAASEPQLAQSALDLVKKTNFGFSAADQRDAYINVRFGN